MSDMYMFEEKGCCALFMFVFISSTQSMINTHLKIHIHVNKQMTRTFQT